MQTWRKVSFRIELQRSLRLFVARLNSRNTLPSVAHALYTQVLEMNANLRARLAAYVMIAIVLIAGAAAVLKH